MARQRIALFLRTLEDEYQRAQKSEFYARAHVHLFSVTEYDAKNDAETQLRQVQESLHEPPKAVFIAPVSETRLRAAARDAIRLGVGWVTLNRTCDYVTDLRREFPNLPCLCVDPDQEDVGRLQAQQLQALLPKGGNVLYIHGPLTTSSAKRRMTSFETALAGAPFRIARGSGDWSEESGYRAAGSWLRTRGHTISPDWAVVAQNDAMAAGVHRLLAEDAAEKKHSPGHAPGDAALPPIVGCDGLPSYGQRFVADHTLAATVVIPATAARAIDEVALAIRGGKAPGADVRIAVASFPDLDILVREHRGARPRH